MRAHKEQSPENGIDTGKWSKDLLQPELILISAPDDEQKRRKEHHFFDDRTHFILLRSWRRG
jgi:hypothetical protein